MTDRIRSTNVRFNLDKEIPAQAWQYLQTMDRQEFKSYSQVIAAALVDYFDRYYKSREYPYLETLSGRLHGRAVKVQCSRSPCRISGD